jgi:uncharacterized protein
MLACPSHDEVDTGRRSLAAPERLCVLSRSVKPVGELIRFVVGPEGDVVPDVKRRLPGRGIWITARRDAVAEAVKRRAFARAFKREVRVADDLALTVERLLERAALDALAIAHKAGQVVTGFTRVEAALAAGPSVVAALIDASDAARDGRRKLIATAVRHHGRGVRDHGSGAGEPALISLFTSMQLDLALGRSNVVHAALLAGPASDGVLSRCRSLECFRPIGPEDQAR